MDNNKANGHHKASRIVALADTIHKSVAELQAVLDSKGLPAPSFAEDASPDPLPSEAQKAQDAVLDATAELHDILLEPTALVLKTISVSRSHSSCHQQEIYYPFQHCCVSCTDVLRFRMNMLPSLDSFPAMTFPTLFRWEAECRSPTSPKRPASRKE